MRDFWRTMNIVYEKALMLVFGVALLIVMYCAYDTWYVFDRADDDSYLSFKPDRVNAAELEDSPITSDMVAWITIDDTNIDYPVMQGFDNSQYLNLDPYGEYSLSGSIFLDSRNASGFTDPYSIIYGHHMEYGKMFGALDRFLDDQYLSSHRTGTLIVGRNGEKTYSLESSACQLAQAMSRQREQSSLPIFWKTDEKGGQTMKLYSAVSKIMTAAVSLCAVLLFFGFRTNAEFRHVEIKAEVPFSCENVDDSANDYEIVIERLDDVSPMPEKVVTKIGYGNGSFEIGIDEPGTYQYKVYENAGDNSRIIYDDTTYTVTLFVTSDDDGNLDYEVILSKGGIVKPAEISFINKAARAPVTTGEDANTYTPYAIAAIAIGGAVLILALRRGKEEQDV